ncbi:MAG: hypothetical protein JNK56_38620, partial [Myxococcales bacterium]|nr:hypothetical protein [Myxococcales bacterium]
MSGGCELRPPRAGAAGNSSASPGVPRRGSGGTLPLVTRTDSSQSSPAPARDQALAAAVTADPRWAVVCARGEGDFYYSVRTTGVYCRPSCAARPARPENVAFHADRGAAERAGFRACKRC